MRTSPWLGPLIVVSAVGIGAIVAQVAWAAPAPVKPPALFVIASAANLRAKPLADAAVLAKAPIGSRVTVLATEGEQVQVRVDELAVLDVSPGVRTPTGPPLAKKGTSGWMPRGLLVDWQPTAERVDAEYGKAANDAERVSWAERAVALSPRSAAHIERLVKALTAAGLTERMPAAEALLKRAHARALDEAKGAPITLTLDAPSGALTPQDVAEASGIVWVQTDGQVIAYDEKTERWYALEVRGTPVAARGIASVTGGFVWLLVEGGLLRVSARDRVATFLGASDGLPQPIAAIAADGDELFALGVDRVVGVAPNGEVRKVAAIPAGTARALVVDAGALWIALDEARGRHLYRIDAKSGAVTEPAAGKWSAAADNITVSASGAIIASANSKGVYFPHVDGVLMFDKASNDLVVRKAGAPQFVSGASDGLVWIGSSYDVSAASFFAVRYIEDFKKKWEDAFFFESYFQVQSARRLGGYLWFISSGRGLLRWKPKTREVTEFLPRLVPSPVSGECQLYVPRITHTMPRFEGVKTPFLP